MLMAIKNDWLSEKTANLLPYGAAVVIDLDQCDIHALVALKNDVYRMRYTDLTWETNYRLLEAVIEERRNKAQEVFNVTNE